MLVEQVCNLFLGTGKMPVPPENIFGDGYRSFSNQKQALLDSG